MTTILNAPYPAPEPGRNARINAVAVGLFIFIFLLAFQPFGLHYVPWPWRLYATAGYGAVTLAVLLLFLDVLPRVWPAGFTYDHWTVRRHIFYLALAITVVAVGNLLWSRMLGFFPLTARFLAYTIAITFAVGLFPAFAFTALSYIRFLKRYDPAHASLNTPVEASDNPVDHIVLIAENEKDRLELPAEALLYLESADNYTQVVYRRPSGGAPARTLLRGSLTRFEQQIGLPYVRRCHRSFVVNLRQVGRISGNAQGYRLHLIGVESAVPVARRYAQEVVRAS